MQFADDLPWDDEAAAQRAERMEGVAELAILAIIGELENSFERDRWRAGGGGGHSASMQWFIGSRSLP